MSINDAVDRAIDFLDERHNGVRGDLISEDKIYEMLQAMKEPKKEKKSSEWWDAYWLGYNDGKGEEKEYRLKEPTEKSYPYKETILRALERNEPMQILEGGHECKIHIVPPGWKHFVKKEPEEENMMCNSLLPPLLNKDGHPKKEKKELCAIDKVALKAWIDGQEERD